MFVQRFTRVAGLKNSSRGFLKGLLMNQVIKATVLGAQASEFDGNFYGKLFMCQPVAQEDSEGAKGLSVFSIAITKTAYEALKLPPSPAEAEVDVRMKRGAKNAMVTECIGVRLSRSGSTPAPTSPTPNK